MSDPPGQQSTGSSAPPESAQYPPPVHQGSGPSGPRAGFGTRLLALIVDWLVFVIPVIVVFVLFKPAVAYLITIVAYIAYYVILQGGPSGQTVGKRALHIRVVDFNTGGPIGYGRAFVRYLVESILSGIFFLGYLWMLWDREKQTWQDKASSSVVVPESAYPLRS